MTYVFYADFAGALVNSAASKLHVLSQVVSMQMQLQG